MKIFVTGFPGCGKTTLILSLINDLKERKKIAGVVTTEIREKNRRRGFLIKDIASNKEEILASTNGKGPKIGKYHVNIEGINKMVKETEKSIEKAEILIIDEIGKMEFFSDAFKEMISKIIDSEKNVVATLHRNYIKIYKDKGTIMWLEKNKVEDTKKKILELIL
ncbi:MAG: NTPase [Candidatus Pacearchaeota archaeon]|nr:NTPase [Candidatus Pacearchaeota archaeon]